MPTYHVTLHDGRSIQVDADSPEHADLAAGEFMQAHPAAKKATPAGDFFKNLAGNVPVGVGAVADMVMAAIPGAGLADQVLSGNPTGMPTLAHPTGNALARIASRYAPKPQTVAGEYGRTLGQFLPAAAAPGSIPARLANVVVPALTSETTGQVARKLGASPNVEQLLRMFGGLAGGGLSSVRARPPAPAASALPRAVHAEIPTIAPRSALKASDYVAKVAGSAGATPDSLAAARSGRPITAAEAMGKPGETALSALGRRPGMTGDALGGKISERQLARPGRMMADLAEASGISPEAAAGDMDAFITRGRAAAKPLYDAAYEAGPISTPALDVLVGRPSMQSAMARAARIAAEEGRDPTELGFRVVKRGAGSTGRDAATTAPDLVDGRHQVIGSKRVEDPNIADVSVQVENPTAHTWDYVKRGIDDVINGYRDPTTGRLKLDEEGRAVVATSKALMSELRTANPIYGHALDTAGDYLSARQSFDNGGKFLFNDKINERDFAGHLERLSDAEIEAFKGGVANKVFDLAQTGRLNPKALQTPRVRAKLNTLLGKDQATRLIQSAEDERAMQAFERKAHPDAGSPTAGLMDAMREQDGGGELANVAGDLVSGMKYGPKGAVAKAGGNFVGRQLQGIADRVRTNGLDIPSRDAAGKLLMLPPDDLAAFLRSRPKPQSPLMLGGPAADLVATTARVPRAPPSPPRRR